QRLLGLTGLYLMREIEPDYAAAPTVQGALQFTTLGKSKGRCDYTSIFNSIGFQPNKDPFWLTIEDFEEGFYDALDMAKIRRNEADILHETVSAVNNLQIVGENKDSPSKLPIRLCENEDRAMIEREISVLLPKAA
ncbi:MAG TPA: hypothetical protein VD947_03335, partial [Patescibacteria group bacterium]|nr:hypothetical protein [Patescibacteria group bacterium]